MMSRSGLAARHGQCGMARVAATAKLLRSQVAQGWVRDGGQLRSANAAAPPGLLCLVPGLPDEQVDDLRFPDDLHESLG
jgi:hypothetical protein